MVVLSLVELWRGWRDGDCWYWRRDWSGGDQCSRLVAEWGGSWCRYAAHGGRKGLDLHSHRQLLFPLPIVKMNHHFCSLPHRLGRCHQKKALSSREMLEIPNPSQPKVQSQMYPKISLYFLLDPNIL